MKAVWNPVDPTLRPGRFDVRPPPPTTRARDSPAAAGTAPCLWGPRWSRDDRNPASMAEFPQSPPSEQADQQTSGRDKGRLAGMAILDPELGAGLREQLPELGVPPRETIRTAGRAGGAAQARRHALRRLVSADVVGLAIAAFVGPLVVSLVSDNPDSTPPTVHLRVPLQPGGHPPVRGVFALYGLYRGVTRRITNSVFSDLRNIVHALMISGFLYAIVGVRGPPQLRAGPAVRGQDRLHVPGGRGRRPAGPGRGLRLARPRLGWGRSRSSWSGRASWPRPWRATSGPTPTCDFRRIRGRQPPRAGAT